MSQLPGVTSARKKDGTIYYRSSITLSGRHLSLGSFSDAENAGNAYKEACLIIKKNSYRLEDYNDSFSLSFEKFIVLMNYRNCGIYFKTPIYLHHEYFYYYLSPDKYLIFDREDLFFYAEHKIQTRGGYYFIYNYGSQYSILSRYGIKSYAKCGIDYIFINQNKYDFRYENIKVINEYMGVTEIRNNETTYYECKIHIRGNNLVGRYKDKITAAIAYNKAVDTLAANGIHKQYVKNYITQYNSKTYHEKYASISISKGITSYTNKDFLKESSHCDKISTDSNK